MKDLIERLEAALGDTHDPVKVALVAGDVRALIAAHKAATAERNALRAELGAGLGDALQRTSDLAREVFELRQERDAEKAKLKALREAAGALVAEVENTSSHALMGCDYCRALAIHGNELHVACDEHRRNLDDEYDVYEMSYAAPLRAIRAALKEES